MNYTDYQKARQERRRAVWEYRQSKENLKIGLKCAICGFSLIVDLHHERDEKGKVIEADAAAVLSGRHAGAVVPWPMPTLSLKASPTSLPMTRNAGMHLKTPIAFRPSDD